MLVFGTRPEAIKMCPLVNVLKSRPESYDVIVTVTGQHKEMLQQVLDVFGVVPDHDLKVMKPGQTLFDVTCDVLTRLKPILEEEKPDSVLVHGDTSTSFAAALGTGFPWAMWRRDCEPMMSTRPGQRSLTVRPWTLSRIGILRQLRLASIIY